MSARFLTLAAGATLLLASAAVSAQAIEEKNVISGKAKQDAARGYIFLHAPSRWYGTFLRVPDESTRAEHQVEFDKAFAKELKRHESRLASWRSSVDIAKRTKSKIPAKPEEPSRDKFSIGPIELRDSMPFGPMYVFAKGETRMSYMNSVKPGTYIWYGPVMIDPQNGVMGQCFCMGTVRFEVKPGMVTDLGNFLLAAPPTVRNFDVGSVESWRRLEEKAAKTGKPIDPALTMRAPLEFGLPESIKGWGAAKAEFHASGKMNNYYGISVSRMPPIPGVLAYRRDTVIDERSGTDVPSPPIVTQVRIKK